MLSPLFNPNDHITPMVKARLYRGQSLIEPKLLEWRPEYFKETRPATTTMLVVDTALPKRDLLILSAFDAKECYRTFNNDAPPASRMPSLLGRGSSSRVASIIPSNLGGSASEILMQGSATLAPVAATTTLKRKKTFSMFTEAEQRLNAWAPQPTLGRIRDLLSPPPPPSQPSSSSVQVSASSASLRAKERSTPSSSLRGGRSAMQLGDESIGGPPPLGLIRQSTLPSLRDNTHSQTLPTRKSATTPPPTLTAQHLVTTPSNTTSRTPTSRTVQAATPPGRIRPMRNNAAVGEKPHTASTSTAHNHAHTPPPTKSSTFTSSSTTNGRQLLPSPSSASHQQPASRVAARNAKEGVANRGTDSLPPLSDWALKRIQK
eukprot:TRINITY_DN21538_c0_g1_i1.p1 TRINITY_DN21538_c0_g1~~TRINITY_DN21538_c0_g1_i1.p1  ORF type:complete len:375 (+),score=-12.20 TRINITY_DN21538_c0_g1_i1:116-1240(+)